MVEYIFRNNSNIGNLEAETDLFLQDCFIETEAYRILSSFGDTNGDISDTLQDWMIERVSNNFVKTNKLEVVGMDGFAEYKNIPFWNKMPLYEDFKHSVVCSATALVDFAPITSDKNKPSGDNKNENIKESKYIEEISVRYQLIDGGGIRMSGIDVHDMTKQVKEKGAKHKKK